jgi:hypothetical protein
MLFPLRLVDFETLRDWERFDVDTGNDSALKPAIWPAPDTAKTRKLGTLTPGTARAIPGAQILDSPDNNLPGLRLTIRFIHPMLELTPADPIIRAYIKDLQRLKDHQVTHELGQ